MIISFFDYTKPPPDHQIFCDLDGVLVDFSRGVSSLFDPQLTINDLPSHVLWSAIDHCPHFYKYLPWTKDGQELWKSIYHLNPSILTGVSRTEFCAEDKYEWYKRELPLFGRCPLETNHVNMAGERNEHANVHGIKYKNWKKRKNGFWRNARVIDVITCWKRNKHVESGKHCVLIDDNKELREDWEKKGGVFVWHMSTEGTLKELRILKKIEGDDKEDNNKNGVGKNDGNDKKVYNNNEEKKEE